jgi:kynurenine formamidase
MTTELRYEECTTPVKFCTQSFVMKGGVGTHIDSPAHCFAGGKTVDQLPVQELCKPCVVIDISDRPGASYRLSVDDIREFEKAHGAIEADSIVFLYTGWSKFWDDAQAYRNNLCFPTYSNEAAEYLLTKNIAGIGIDTLSPDMPESGYPVHELMLGAGKYILENVANLDQMPSVGAFCLVAPLKVEGATEAPVRLIGFI